MYLPNQNITRKTTSGNELIFRGSRQPFIGDYIKTNKGKMYAGVDNTNPGLELIYKEEYVDSLKSSLIPYQKIISSTNQAKRYNFSNKLRSKNFLANIIPIPSVKVKPVPKDYFRGFYFRYFAKRVNTNKYLEIDKDTYNSIKNKEPKYDYNLYNVGKLEWFIVGNSVYAKNSASIKKTQRRFPNIFYLFPILNEFMAPSSEVQENLYTEGGELYYGDGTEYIGHFHIHPSKGPMEGALHTLSPHPYLYYFNQLPQLSDSSYQDFLENYNKVTCYKCITVGFDVNQIPINQIVALKRSRLLGCPQGSSQDFKTVNNGCFERESTPGGNTTTGTGGDREEGNTILLGGTGNNGNYCGNDGWGYGNGNFGGFGTIPPFPGGSGYTGGGGGGGSAGGSGGGGFGDFEGTCFTANTLITMADGTEKTISSIKAGEKVKSEIGESTVLEVQIHNKEDYEVYSINGGKPFVTEEHPFKTIDGWKAINPFTTLEKHQINSDVLNLQDIVYKLNGKEIIESIEKGKITYPKVYNLSLDNEHVYYANGYLVHNEKGAGLGLDDLENIHGNLNTPGGSDIFGG